MNQIKKRDGSLVPFDSTKIRNAIMKANVRVADEPMTDDDLDFLAQRVVKKLEKENAVPDVEHVQDIVERTLSKAGYSRTAKAYILYRAEHAKMREMRDTLPDIFSNLTFAAAKDVDMKRENANINTDTAMGTMLKFGTESAKDYFDKYIIPSHIAQADKDGDIHIHDKDFYTLTETCCQIDLLKLFKNGFSTGHGYLREPNSIRSYAALACIAIQSNQNEMHGGQAVPNFDYAMAEGVRKTYRKAILKHTAEVLENRNVWPVGKGYEELKKIVNEKNIPVPTMGQKDDDTWPGGFNDRIHEALDTWGLLFTEHYKPIAQRAYADTVDETHQAMEAVIHNLNSMHCLLPSEKVWTEYRDENGVNTITTMTIMELYRLVNDVADHHTWLKVYSVNPATGRIEMKPVYAARRMDKDRDMVTLVSKSGNKVTCTTNHRIIQLVDGKLTEVLPKDATHLVINRNVVNASTITPDKVKKAYDALGNRYDDLVVSEIVDREYFNSGDEYVYDISVVDNENFMLADGTFVHNSRAGAQVPFSSINYGTDTSPEGQLVIKEILQATEEGLGNGETPIFPVQIFKVKEGTNYNPGDPNYDLFKQAMKVSAKRLFPNFSFMDAPFNAQYLGRHPDKPYYDEVGYMGCVHANTIVTYKENNQAHITSIENAWNTLSQRYPVLTHGGSEFIDLANTDVTIYDTKAKDYVKVKKWIKNPAPKEWLKIICNETFVVVTPDHPLMACLGHEDDPNAHDLAERRVRAENLKAGVDSLYKVKNGHIVKTKITSIVAVPSKDGEYSYDVETASDRFDANFFVSHNCRTRVMGNVYDPENEVTPGRGNLSFTSINLPRIAIQSRNLTDDDGNFNAPADMAKFYRILDERIDLCIEQLLHRFKIQCSKHAYNYPFLMGEGVWIDSEKLAPMDTVGEVLKHGTLSVGFIGLAETLIALTGKHHGESEESWKLGYEIVKHIRDRMDQASELYKLNFSCLATPAEGLCLAENTSIHTTDGLKAIKDIKPGDTLLTYNEQTKKVEPDTVVAAGMTGMRSDIFEIMFNEGTVVRCTSNHPFAKENEDGNVTWTAAENLKKYACIKAEDGGYRVVTRVEKLDTTIPVYDVTMENNHNFFIGPWTGILVHNSGTFVRIDKKKFGIIPGITDRDYYTNSFHIPVYYPISAFDKIKKEAPFHALTNAGHISYVEVDGDIAKNIDAFESIIRCMKESGIGYGSVNHPVDRDPICGYVGIINETCPRCGRHEGEAVPLNKLEELKLKYRNMPDITKYIE